MARRVQLATPAAAARPGAIPGRMIGGRELPTSPLTTDSDGPPCAAGNPGGRCPPGCYPGSHNWHRRELPTVQLATPAAAARPGAIAGCIIGRRELPTLPLTTDLDGSPYADQRPRQQQPTRAITRTNPTANWHLLPKSPLTTDSSDPPRRHQEPAL